VHHLSPELIRRPDWLAHANGALRLISVTVACAQPVDAAMAYLPIFGPEHIKVTDGLTSVSCGNGALRFVTAEALQEFYPAALPEPLPDLPFVVAMKMLVADKARCLAHLAAQGVAYQETKQGCLVPAAEANGAVLEFVAG
jgi:hypothetical protein